MAKAQASTVKRQWRAPLHLWTAISMAVLLVAATGLITWRGYRGAEDALVSASIESIGHVRDALTEKIRRILELAEAQLSQLAYSELSKANTLEQRLQALPAMAETLKDNDLVDALYAGYPNGEFVLFRPLRTDQDRERFKAPAAASILVQSITATAGGGKSGEYRFYDAGLSELEVRPDANYKYDPRGREWYKDAATASGPILTDPYVFFTTHAPGRTMARHSADGLAIVGLDVRLGTLAGELHRLNITPSTEMAIVDSDRRVIAYSDLGKSIVPTGADSFRLAQLDELGVPPLQRASALVGAGKVRFRAIVDGRAWQLIAAKIELHDMQPLHLVLAVPDDEFFASARAIVWHQFRVAAIVLIVSVAGVWWVTQRLVRSLRRLVKETTAISRFDFRQDQSIDTRIGEVHELELALDSLKRTIRQFLEIGNALAAEREFRPLLERVLREIIGLVKSDGGAIFLLDETGRNLLPSMVRWRSEEVEGEAVGLAPIPMGKPGLFAELVAALQSRQIVTVERHLEDGELDALGLRRFVNEGDFVRVTMVIVPLLNRSDAPLGALTLIKGMRVDSKRWKVGDRLADIIRAVSGSVSAASRLSAIPSLR